MATFQVGSYIYERGALQPYIFRVDKILSDRYLITANGRNQSKIDHSYALTWNMCHNRYFAGQTVLLKTGRTFRILFSKIAEAQATVWYYDGWGKRTTEQEIVCRFCPSKALR